MTVCRNGASAPMRDVILSELCSNCFEQNGTKFLPGFICVLSTILVVQVRVDLDI